MKKFQLKRIGESETIGNFYSKADAAEHMVKLLLNMLISPLSTLDLIDQSLPKVVLNVTLRKVL